MEHPETQETGEDETSSGFYAQDVAFRSGFVQLQTPMSMAYAAASQGFVPPDPRGPFTYMDLGCGDGTTLNALASLYPESAFVGIDFNPGHIERARRVADEARLSNVRYIEGSFAQVDAASLPTCDFVGMNGIYSWLENDLCAAVRGLLDACLKPGGLFYVEFTTLPGAISQWPLWHLIQGLVPPEAASDSRERAETALNLLEKLVDGGMGYLQAHPTARRAAVNYINQRKRSANTVDHFAHNALASGFRPRFFSEMCQEMAQAGLSYVGRASVRYNELELAVPAKQAGLLRQVHDSTLREQLIDYIRNDNARRAVFVKDGEQAPEAASEVLYNSFHVVTNRSSERIPRFVRRHDNTRFPLQGAGYDALFKGFDGEAKRLADLPEAERVSAELLVPSFRRVVASGEVTLALRPVTLHREVTPPENIVMDNPMNRRLLTEAKEEFRRSGLVSPITGGRVAVLGPFQVLFLDAWLQYGYENSLAAVMGLLGDLQGSVRIQGTPVKASEVTADQLRGLLTNFINGPLTRLISFGVIRDADGDGATAAESTTAAVTGGEAPADEAAGTA